MTKNRKSFESGWRLASAKLFAQGEITLGQLFVLLFIATFKARLMAQYRQMAIETMIVSGAAENARDDEFDWETFLEALMQFLMVILPLIFSS